VSDTVNLAERFRHITHNDSPEGVFLRMLLAVTVIASASHLAFIFLFDSAGVVWLSRINVASVLVYVLAALLLQHQHPMVALGLIGGEVVLHGVLATYVIGWEAGFHFYLILVVPVAIVSSLHKPWVKAAIAIPAGLLYMALDLLLRHATPLEALPPAMLAGLHYFNLGGTLLILGLLSTVYYRLVAGADARLRHQACTDPLTQLRNRRFAMEVIQHEAAVCQRAGRPLALVIGDVDHFKRVNDGHGHEAGDTALKAVAQALREGVREVDHVARWGGEEFLMLLPEADARAALLAAERVRHSVQALAVQHKGQHLPLTITLGVSVLARGETIEQALARADRALYRGKQEGRNRAVLAGQD
jgi:diguanylate cyclase (GGDEF)-like protein